MWYILSSPTTKPRLNTENLHYSARSTAFSGKSQSAELAVTGGFCFHLLNEREIEQYVKISEGSTVSIEGYGWQWLIQSLFTYTKSGSKCIFILSLIWKEWSEFYYYIQVLDHYHMNLVLSLFLLCFRLQLWVWKGSLHVTGWAVKEYYPRASCEILN